MATFLTKGFTESAGEFGTRTRFGANGEIQPGLPPTFAMAAAGNAPLVSAKIDQTFTLNDPGGMT